MQVGQQVRAGAGLEKAFVGRASLFESAFDTAHTVQLTASYLNMLVEVGVFNKAINYAITLPPASAGLVGAKIGFLSSPDVKVAVYSRKNVSLNNVIGVSLTVRAEFVVVSYGGGDYNWAVRYLDQAASAGASPVGTTRDPYDVDTAKAIQVVDANVPFLQETDSSYYGKKILNRTYRPDRPALYECMIERPLQAINPNTGQPNPSIWGWVRLPIV